MNAIAIDGFSSTGKSSVAKILAQRLGYLYVDTGAMYRAVALHALRNGWVGSNGSSVNADAAEALRGAFRQVKRRLDREPIALGAARRQTLIVVVPMPPCSAGDPPTVVFVTAPPLAVTR